MTTYSFDDITVAQAAAFTSTDVLTFPTGRATDVTVLYGASTITILLNGRTVDFSASVASVSQPNGLSFADGSLLYIGDDMANTSRFLAPTAHALALFGGAGDDTLTARSDSHALVQGNAGND